MKRLQVLLLIIFPIYCFAASSDFDDGKKLISQKEYIKGRTLLFKVVNSPETPIPLKAKALNELATFYEDIVCQHDMALKLYKKILKLKLPADDIEKQTSQNKIETLNISKQKYKDADILLEKIILNLNGKDEPFEIEARITQLQNMIDQYPDYYKLSFLYYYIGKEYYTLKKYKKAEKAFSKAIEITPGIDFNLPVTENIKLAVSNIKENLLTNIITGFFVSILAIITISFYFSRPWRWITPRHLALISVILFVWTLLYYISFYVTGAIFQAPQNIAEAILSENPSFVNALPGGNGSEITHVLFVYGTIGIIGCCLFALVADRIKKRWVAFLISVPVSLLFMVSIISFFYLNECYKKSTYYISDENTGGHIYFQLSDPEHFVLTNPTKYGGLNLQNVESEYLKNWIIKNTDTKEDMDEETIQMDK